MVGCAVAHVPVRVALARLACFTTVLCARARGPIHGKTTDLMIDQRAAARKGLQSVVVAHLLSTLKRHWLVSGALKAAAALGRPSIHVNLTF